MKKLTMALILVSGLVYANDVNPINNKLVQKECSSCHMAYQPGLLPSRSWTKIMGNLSNHFGADASVNAKDNKSILAYLKNNASDNSSQYLSRVMTKYIRRSETPIRITDTRVFRSVHGEVRRSAFKRKSVGSAGNCAACHRTAKQGSYNEEYVRIPR